jgi:hypothetical protein
MNQQDAISNSLNQCFSNSLHFNKIKNRFESSNNGFQIADRTFVIIILIMKLTRLGPILVLKKLFWASFFKSAFFNLGCKSN